MTSSPIVVGSRWKAVSLGLAVALAGLIIWDGADRKAADATDPLPQSASGAFLQSAPPTLKLGSFNIHGGKGVDGVRNLTRTADLLHEVDVAGLYEVRALPTTELPNQAASLASTLQVAWLFAPTERSWWSDHFGNGMLSRIPIRSVLRIPLVNTRGKAYRNAILATVALQTTDVRIIAVHVDRENDRRHQLQAVIDLFLNLQEPCLLMGDLNTNAADPLLRELRERPGVRSPLHDAAPQGPTSSNIDWIFTRGLKTISAELVENTASDHPLLRVELAPVDGM